MARPGQPGFSVPNMTGNSAKYCTCEELCFWQVTVTLEQIPNLLIQSTDH